MFSVITNIYNKKTKGSTLMELFTATGKLKKFFFLTTRDFFGLCRKLSPTRSTSSSAVNGQPLDFCLHRRPVSVNCLHHAQMVLFVGGTFAYFARNARCTITRLTHVIFQHTKRLSGHFLTAYTRIA
jgi:hypothetical protein